MGSDLSLCRLGTTGSLLPSVRAQDPGFMDILLQNYNPELGGLCVPQTVRGHVHTTLEGVGQPGLTEQQLLRPQQSLKHRRLENPHPDHPLSEDCAHGRARKDRMLVGISNSSQEEGWESYSGRVCKIVLHLRELGWGLSCLMNLVENEVAVGHAPADHLGPLCV